MTNDQRSAKVDVLIGGTRVPISRTVFLELFENSVVSDRIPVLRAIETSQIEYSKLVEQARIAAIPHPLFFAPQSFVHAQVEAKIRKLMQGVRPETFTVNSRTKIRLSDVELVIQDLLRKQALVKRHDLTLTRNLIVGLLRRPGATVAHDAEALLDALELDRQAIWTVPRKERALDLIVEHLEAKQVLVSRSVQNYMPQLIRVRFSGLTIRDSKVPYIFLAGGDHGDSQEPVGRQIFTLTLMAVLVARGIFAPVSYDASSTAPSPGREYDIVGEILMPVSNLRHIELDDLDKVKAAADFFKVTPSALTVRALRLGLLTAPTSAGFLRELEMEFRGRGKPIVNQPKPVNAIRKYNGRALTSRLLRAVDERRLSEGDFCRVVCLNHLGPSDLGDLRAAIR